MPSPLFCARLRSSAGRSRGVAYLPMGEDRPADWAPTGQCVTVAEAAETVEPEPERAARHEAPGPQTGAQRSPWWRRIIGG